MWSELVLHGWDFDSLVQRSLSYKILLVDLWHRLSSKHRLDFHFLFSLLSVQVEVFSLLLVVIVSFLLILKGVSFLVNLSLSEDTWLYVDLSDRLQVDIHCVIPFIFLILFLHLLFLRLIHCFIQLSHYFRIKLSHNLSSFRPENPIWHLRQCFLPLSCLKVMRVECSRWVIVLFFCLLFWIED